MHRISFNVLEMAKGGEQHQRNPHAVMKACKDSGEIQTESVIFDE